MNWIRNILSSISDFLSRILNTYTIYYQLKCWHNNRRIVDKIEFINRIIFLEEKIYVFTTKNEFTADYYATFNCAKFQYIIISDQFSFIDCIAIRNHDLYLERCFCDAWHMVGTYIFYFTLSHNSQLWRLYHSFITE